MRKVTNKEIAAKKEAIDPLFERLTNESRRLSGAVFQLNQPATVTVRSKRGAGYTRRPQVGDEKFLYISGYVGKSGKLIAVMNRVGAEADYTIEMPFTEALICLNGFPLFIRGAVFHDDLNSAVASAIAEYDTKHAAEKPKQVDMTTKYRDFGTW